MIPNGKIVKSDSGRRIRADGFIAAGGQGEAYWATDLKCGQRGVLKAFHQRFADGDTLTRIRFLVAQNLAAACPVLCAPTDILSTGPLLGHFSPFAPGQPLEAILEKPDYTFLEGLQLSLGLAHALALMHRRGISHGDLRAQNLIVNRAGTALQASLIDFDNFNASTVPPPPMAGESLYMAPELSDALAHSRVVAPDFYTDRFSLGVLMHEIILLRHVAAGADDSEAHFQKAMRSGRWLQDPAGPDKRVAGLGGYPVEVLNTNMARLFRFALSLEPAARPSPDVWESAIGKALGTVNRCPRCGGPCLIDVSKSVCPLCGTPFPHLGLAVAGGKTISLDRGTVRVGRDDIGGSMKVSHLHAVFHRVGPETWIESLGSNGSYRWTGSAWARLPDKQPILVQEGDILLLGDVETRLG